MSYCVTKNKKENKKNVKHKKGILGSTYKQQVVFGKQKNYTRTSIVSNHDKNPPKDLIRRDW